MSNDFFDKIDDNKKDLKPMTDKEVEEMCNTIGSTYKNYQADKKNIYQVVAIIFMVLGFISSFILSVGSDNPSILFIGIASTFVSGLFMYGFGEIIKQLKIANILNKSKN